MSFETFEKLDADKKAAILHAGIEEFSHKSYQEANTDLVVAACGISKGSLYHYFGNKKGFYLHLVDVAVHRVLSTLSPPPVAGDFLSVVFSALDHKLRQAEVWPHEVALLNLAARETCAEVREEGRALLTRAMAAAQAGSRKTLEAALASLSLRPGVEMVLALRGLSLYVNAITMEYLERYKEEPARFFAEAPRIREELAAYLGLFLDGIRG